MVAEGSRALDFTLPTDDGDDITLSSLRGKKVILYFYPKDNTPGCTIQACDFRDAHPSFEGLNAVVLGVSADSLDSHSKFRRKFDLNFPLLSDPDHTVAEAYGAWKERTVFGKIGLGIVRSAFLVGRDGLLRGVWMPVKPEDTVPNALAVAKTAEG